MPGIIFIAVIICLILEPLPGAVVAMIGLGSIFLAGITDRAGKRTQSNRLYRLVRRPHRASS
ncbi:hypothetical protein JHU04_003192 [Brenneria sp. 4F2]|nr:hypothetical protein [Brenneria bubanii]